MPKPLRPFLAFVFCVWVLLSIAGFWYSNHQHIPSAVVGAALPAMLLEIGLYLASGFEPVRERLAALGSKPRIALWLWASALAPYLLYALLSGTFDVLRFLALAGLVAVPAFWYVLLPAHSASDALFLIYMVAVWLAKRVVGYSFADIYIRLEPHAQIELIGTLMWVRTGILAVLLLRGLEGVRFGFFPSRREWRIGLLCFALFLPIGYVLNLFVQFAPYRTLSMDPGRILLVALGTFIGILWVQSVPEEFFFRGMILQLLQRRLHVTAALIISSLLFGLSHLPYRQFPNWKFVCLASVAGIFYGIAYLRAGSIRASMVTHALVVTSWRVFFNG